MVSHLGPILPNIFVVFYKSKIHDDKWPEDYDRCVDDVFLHFDNKKTCHEFLTILYGRHPTLNFTCECEKD